MSPTAASGWADSAYLSPSGAPQPHPNTDPYAALCARVLSPLEAMGYEPKTMAEGGVVWAEDQDPSSYVIRSYYLHFLGVCSHCFMESYDEWFSEKEYNDIIHARNMIPIIRN